jgi:hypothetical protein
MKDPPKASSINSADNFTTIIFDLCNPMNMDTGLEILTSVGTAGTSISGLRWKNRMQSKI